MSKFLRRLNIRSAGTLILPARRSKLRIPQCSSQVQSHFTSPRSHHPNHPSLAINRSFLSWFSPRFTHVDRSSSSVTSEENPADYRSGRYHPVHLGDIFNDRYKVISKLGYGVYSTVWLAGDLNFEPHRHVALKILTAESYGGTNAVYELDILKHLNQINSSHPGCQHVVHLSDSFIHEGQHGNHLCMALDLMGQSVLDLQRCFPNRQLPIHIVRQVATQMLQALDWLHTSCGVIHTDIKPDNILVELPADMIQDHSNKSDHSNISPADDSGLLSRPIVNNAIDASSKLNFRITDFGVASWTDKHLAEWIQPVSLRAPEVFLGAPWDCSVDVWGLACVIYELLQGRILFRGAASPKGTWTAEEDQLAQMIELFGPIPVSLLKKGKYSNRYFHENGELLHINQLYQYSLKDLFAQTPNPSMSENEYQQFEAFLRGMLQYEPHQRKTPKELLAEPWLCNKETKFCTT